eukprot:364566-Chlamydomonas_euryale.AAC.4
MPCAAPYPSTLIAWLCKSTAAHGTHARSIMTHDMRHDMRHGMRFRISRAAPQVHGGAWPNHARRNSCKRGTCHPLRRTHRPLTSPPPRSQRVSPAAAPPAAAAAAAAPCGAPLRDCGRPQSTKAAEGAEPKRGDAPAASGRIALGGLGRAAVRTRIRTARSGLSHTLEPRSGVSRLSLTVSEAESVPTTLV